MKIDALLEVEGIEKGVVVDGVLELLYWVWRLVEVVWNEGCGRYPSLLAEVLGKDIIEGGVACISWDKAGEKMFCVYDSSAGSGLCVCE